MAVSKAGVRASGATLLTRIPSGPHSAASPLAKVLWAALTTPYRGIAALPSIPAADVRRTRDPLAFCRAACPARAQSNDARSDEATNMRQPSKEASVIGPAPVKVPATALWIRQSSRPNSSTVVAMALNTSSLTVTSHRMQRTSSPASRRVAAAGSPVSVRMQASTTDAP